MTRSLDELLKILPSDVLAGVSGGADSVALLRLLVTRRDRDGGTVTAIHVNHGLRGEASDGDETFVQELCRLWQVPLLTYRACPPDHASEDWARGVRYDFFRQASMTTGCCHLVLAHHMDDQAETILQHLIRGSGLAGLCGMAPVVTRGGLTLYRPLLGANRAQLRSFLREQGISWREDESNQDPVFMRNAIRLKLLPLMEELRPGAAERIASNALMMSFDELHLQREAAALVDTITSGDRLLRRDAFLQQDPSMQSRILRIWINRYEARTLERKETEALLNICLGPVGKEYTLPSRRKIYCGYRYYHLLAEGNDRPIDVQSPAIDHGSIGNRISMRLGPSEGNYGDGKRTQELPEEILKDCVLRTRRIGDRIRPFGSKGSQSLQDYLVDRRVDAPFRDQIPLLARGNEILLVCGVGAGALPHMTKDSNRIRLRWEGIIPWLDD